MDDEAGEMGEAVLVRIREAAAPLKIDRAQPPALHKREFSRRFSWSVRGAIYV